MSFILYDNFNALLKTTDVNMANIVRNSDRECIRQNVIDVFAVVEKEVLVVTPRCVPAGRANAVVS